MRPSRASAVRRTERECQRAFVTGFDVRCQLPLALGGRNEPLPDIAVVAGAAEDYDDVEHSTTAVLVVEVSDSSLRYDRTTKASLYARAGIPEHWVLNLVDRNLEVYRSPVPDRAQPLRYGYETRHTVPEAGSISPLSADTAHIRVSDLLPAATG